MGARKIGINQSFNRSLCLRIEKKFPRNRQESKQVEASCQGRPWGEEYTLKKDRKEGRDEITTRTTPPQQISDSGKALGKSRPTQKGFGNCYAKVSRKHAIIAGWDCHHPQEPVP